MTPEEVKELKPGTLIRSTYGEGSTFIYLMDAAYLGQEDEVVIRVLEGDHALRHGCVVDPAGNRQPDWSLTGRTASRMANARVICVP